jgi:Raf kinase inhibitor-like YbhB/YbcL family protein
MALSISSPAFTHNGRIPTEHTCDDADAAPPLDIRGVPTGAKSLALIVDDPDAPDPKAPKMTYVHWVAYDLPPSTARLDGGALPKGARDGVNDWKKTGYGGPCPPIGRHRYYFKLYALDKTLGDLQSPTKARLLEAMKGHVLEQAELMGTYERTKGKS